jgi:hypothetical protein
MNSRGASPRQVGPPAGTERAGRGTHGQGLLARGCREPIRAIVAGRDLSDASSAISGPIRPITVGVSLSLTGRF